MTELYPTDATLDALSGGTTPPGVPLPTIGEQPWYTAMYKALWRLATSMVPLAGLEVFAETVALKFGVREGYYRDARTVRSYAGATGQTVVDDAVNYIYLDLSGGQTLTINQSGFPDISAPHVPLATIATGTQSASAASGFRPVDITDYRGRCLLGQDAVELAERHVDLRELAGDGEIVDGGWGTGGLHRLLPAVQNDTAVHEVRAVVELPAEYVASADVQLIVNAEVDDSGGGTLGACTVDVEAYELADDGTVGADLCATAAQSIDTAAADDAFTITDAGLAPGDRLQVYVRTTVIENADAGTLRGRLNSIRLAADRLL